MSDLQQFAREAVACPGWRWMLGMVGIDRAGGRSRVLTVADDGGVVEWAFLPSREDGGLAKVVTAWGTPGWAADVWGAAIPDLTDPATLGCLLALVREAWQTPDVFCCRQTKDPSEPEWCVVRRLEDGGEEPIGGGPTEAHALVAALKSAAKKEK